MIHTRADSKELIMFIVLQEWEILANLGEGVSVFNPSSVWNETISPFSLA
jgi:hypothetical protein